MSRSGTFILTFLIAVSLNATAATKAVKFGKLWDGHRVITNAVVIVENDRVQSVTASGRIPAGADSFFLSGELDFIRKNNPAFLSALSHGVLAG